LNAPLAATRPATHPRRGQMLLLALLFFLPLLAAFIIYYGSHWRPAHHVNHGELIDPAAPLLMIALPQVTPEPAAGGAALAAANVLAGKWSLVYVGRGDCDGDCRDTLYFMRQTHLGLANLIPRVQRVFLATDGCCDRNFLAREQPNLVTLDANGAAGAALLAPFPLDRRATTIFVVDPRGNLMMRYDAHEDPKGLRNDLKRLLLLSHIG
jgi:cytochrome oxidase Cu insertion factor (SCO1/SenC/PrrC family)